MRGRKRKRKRGSKGHLIYTEEDLRNIRKSVRKLMKRIKRGEPILKKPPRKIDLLLSQADHIKYLREKGESYKSIAEILKKQNPPVEVSPSYIRLFCLKYLGEAN